MSVPRYAQLAGRVLARSEVAIPAPAPGARAAAIEAVEAALRARARRRIARRWAASALGAVAAAALVVAAARHVARLALPPAAPALAVGPLDAVRIVARPVSAGEGAAVLSALPATEGWALGAGSRVFAPLDGRVMLSLSTGTTALVHEGGDMTVVGTGRVQVFRIDAGSVEFHVAKLSAGERFLVDTSDTEVEVRGTRFTVSIAAEPCASNGALTRVAVAEGVVVARREGSEVRIKAGERWPAACDRPKAAAVAATSLPIAAPSSPPPSPRAPRVSALAEQNGLFAAAVAAKQRDDTRGALAVLDRLISKYPSGPLDESARAERLRLLRAAGSERSAAAARDYLARYPQGFARAEAEAALAAER